MEELVHLNIGVLTEVCLLDTGYGFQASDCFRYRRDFEKSDI